MTERVEISHDELMAFYRLGRIAAGVPLMGDWEEKPESVDLRELGLGVVGLVDEVQYLRQQIAVRREADRRAEQERLGYR